MLNFENTVEKNIFYRVVYENVNEEDTTVAYALTLCAAVDEMVAEAQEQKKLGDVYRNYTAFRIERVWFGDSNVTLEEDLPTVLRCSELTDIFPVPRKDSYGNYEDEYDFEDEDDLEDEDDFEDEEL